MPLLEHTLATRFEPGTNRKGQVVGAAWTLLLDRLELGNVVCLGLPGERTLGTLARRAGSVAVVCTRGERRRAGALIASARVPDFSLLAVEGISALGTVDLVVITSAGWARRATAERALARLVGGAGAVYAELGGVSRVALGGSRLEGRLAAAAGTPQPLWLGVSGREVELAAGRDDAAAIALLRRPPAAVAAGGRPGVRELARRVRRRARIRTRRGLLIPTDRAGSIPGAPPPGYLREMAERAGSPINDCRAALAAPSDYPSRKAVLFLLPVGSAVPAYVVKLTRDAAFNDRLENEWRALRALERAGIGDDTTVPRGAFLGHAAGLAVLGQTAIAGVPFRQRTTATADCPLARGAADWLMDLGASTADSDAASSGQVAAALRRLLDRFAELYQPTAAEHAVLAAHVDAVARSGAPFPLVFQHGDPGTWNLLITADGRPAFLDWEAAEVHGMPLWDLFYFGRSVGMTVSRAAGTRSALDAFAEQYLSDSELNRWLAGAVASHCARIALDPGLVPALFFTCWMHRALKEAMRLSPHALAGGRYVALLRLCLERRDAPALRRLLGGAPT